MTIPFDGRVAIVTGAGGGLGRAYALELAMTEDIFPPDMFAAFNPDNVVPAALFLVSETAPSNMIVGAGAGVVQASYVTLTPGHALPEGRRTVEEVAENWDRIIDRSGEIVPGSGAEQAMLILQTLFQE